MSAKHLFTILFLALSVCAAGAADRIAATITITNIPADAADTLTVNGNVRTWKTTVATPSSQIAISAASTGANGTNLYNQIAAYPYAGPLTLIRVATNIIRLQAPVGVAISASAAGTWATVVLSTQAVTAEWNVSVPLTARPVLSDRTNIASLLVSNVFNLGLVTQPILPTSTAMSNFVTLSGAQTINQKTIGNAQINGSTLTNSYIRQVFQVWGTNGIGVYYHTAALDPYAVMQPDSDGVPSLFFVNGYEQITTNTPLAVAPKPAHILTRGSGDLYYGALSTTNSWTGTNNFVGAVISNLYASTATNLTIRGPVIAYSTISTGFEAGPGATNIGVGGIAIGSLARSYNHGLALGFEASNNLFTNAFAFGLNTTNTANSQLMLGSPTVAIVDVIVPDNLGIGTDVFPTALAKGILIANGTATTAAPAAGVAMWSVNGAHQYRSSNIDEGLGVNHSHNRALEVVGSGSGYAFTTAYARVDFSGQDPEISLPTAGTYQLNFTIAVLQGATANDDIYFKLVADSGGGDSDIANTQINNASIEAAKVCSVFLTKIWTTSAATNLVKLHGRNLTAARGSVYAPETRCSFVRLY